MTSLARQAAAVRHDEAKRVREAYEVQVKTRRARWVETRTAAASAHAARDLAEAVRQLDAAKQRERAAWSTWHGLTDG